MTQTPSLETIAIGDELLTGKISDTNSTFVANELFALGLRLDRQTVIADEPGTMKRTFEEASKRAHTVICFGGLGPTSDDRTAECVAEFLACKLVEHEPSKKRLTVTVVVSVWWGLKCRMHTCILSRSVRRTILTSRRPSQRPRTKI